MSAQDQIFIFDTTLRDGEQSPGASMTLEEKLQVAEILDDMGVDIIEAGFPIASNGDFEAVSEIAKRTKRSVIAVIYGNFLLALVNAPTGISAIPSMGPMDWFAVAFLGILQIGISYILFVKGVRGGTRPLDASLIGFIEPLLNPVWVFIFVGERPSQWALLGGAIIITAIAAHSIRQYAGKKQVMPA